MTSGAPPLADRVSYLEGAFGQIEGRLSDMNGRLDSVDGHIHDLRGEVGELRREMREEFGSVRVLMFTGMGIMWASMVAGFVAVFTIG